MMEFQKGIVDLLAIIGVAIWTIVGASYLACNVFEWMEDSCPRLCCIRRPRTVICDMCYTQLVAPRSPRARTLVPTTQLRAAILRSAQQPAESGPERSGLSAHESG